MVATLIEPGHVNPFDYLPLEVRFLSHVGISSSEVTDHHSQTTQHIAHYLVADLDLARFRLISRSTNDAIAADYGSFWRKRFMTVFEPPAFTRPGSQANLEFKRTYQKRKALLKRGANFESGNTSREKACLEVIRDLMTDAFSNKQSSGLATSLHQSHNLAHLTRFAQTNPLLKNVFGYLRNGLSKKSSSLPQTPTPLLHMIQLLCAPLLLSLDPHIIGYQFSFPDSQLAVYSAPECQSLLIGCHGLDLNMTLLLHNINFWRYHMTREHEHTLYHAFAEVEPAERPSFWSTQLRQNDQSLGRNWKGSYAFIDPAEIRALRRAGPAAPESDRQYQDCFAGEDENFAFQDMQLEIVSDADRAAGIFPWPPLFESNLHSLTTPEGRARTRAQKRSNEPTAEEDWKMHSIAFRGTGEDVMEEFLAAGWLNPLPVQHGVPGWHRVTMMKYFVEEDGSVDQAALWAYEGVLLPGGRLMVGRWWGVDETGNRAECYSGPFLLWCVDK